MKIHYIQEHEFLPSGRDLTEICKHCGTYQTFVHRLVSIYDNRSDTCIKRPVYVFNRFEKFCLKLLLRIVNLALSFLKPRYEKADSESRKK